MAGKRSTRSISYLKYFFPPSTWICLFSRLKSHAFPSFLPAPSALQHKYKFRFNQLIVGIENTFSQKIDCDRQSYPHPSADDMDNSQGNCYQPIPATWSTSSSSGMGNVNPPLPSSSGLGNDKEQEDDGTKRMYCVKWNNQQNDMFKVFENFMRSGFLTDVVLVSIAGWGQGKEEPIIKCHKLILAASSTYFEELIRMTEDNKKKMGGTLPLILIRDIDYPNLRKAIDLIYTGKVFLQEDEITGFIAAVNCLKLKETVPDEKNENATKIGVEEKLKNVSACNHPLIPAYNPYHEGPTTGPCSPTAPQPLPTPSEQQQLHIVGLCYSIPTVFPIMIHQPINQTGDNRLVVETATTREYRSPRKYKQYTKAQFALAMDSVRSGMRCYTAGKAFGIPGRTLYDHHTKDIRAARVLQKTASNPVNEITVPKPQSNSTNPQKEMASTSADLSGKLPAATGEMVPNTDYDSDDQWGIIQSRDASLIEMPTSNDGSSPPIIQLH